MYGLTFKPNSTAFFATSPAPSITDGLLVLVQLVMADITTEPTKENIRCCYIKGNKAYFIYIYSFYFYCYIILNYFEKHMSKYKIRLLY